jgi:hypothetical protein
MPEKAIPVEAEFTLFKKNVKVPRVRRAPRYRCAPATLGRLIVPETGAITDIWINNLSRQGIGLNLEAAIVEQTPVVIQVRNSCKVFRLEARVIHATPQSDGTWRVGCELREELTPEMLDHLL